MCILSLLAEIPEAISLLGTFIGMFRAKLQDSESAVPLPRFLDGKFLWAEIKQDSGLAVSIVKL